MDHDSKKTIRVQISAITFKVSTETTLTPPAGFESAGKTEKKIATYSLDALTLETEESRKIQGDPLPSEYADPSVEEFLKMFTNPAVQQVIGSIVQVYMKGAPAAPPAPSSAGAGDPSAN